MKYVLLAILLLLLAASAATWQALPENHGTAPILYWVTDSNPARIEQVKLFRAWLAKNNLPDIDLRVDASNSDDTKKVIQGVSGVGDDIMDVTLGNMRYFQALGILTDITAVAKRLHFDPSQTWPALIPEITMEVAAEDAAKDATEDVGKNSAGDRRQFMFPCNCFTLMYFVNRGALRKFGQPDPPMRWNAAEFERLGKAFVNAANPPGQRRKFFYADQIEFPILRRSFGLCEFNETLTRCTLDDPRNVSALKLYRKWMFEDHLIPSTAEQASFSTDAAYGGQSPQLFNSGNYAMLLTGRHLIIQFREFNRARKDRGEPPLDLMVVEPPFVEFPNTALLTRGAAIYAGSSHRDLAAYFLSFLASADYNMQIVRDGDAMPPNPAYTRTEEYLRPKDHPDEWRVHQAFADSVQSIGIVGNYSPFVLQSVWKRIDNDARELYLNDQTSAEEAARSSCEKINSEIDRSLREDPTMRASYDRLVALQKQIDERRKRGEKVPASWVKNPFLLAYYKFKDWIE